MATIDPAAAIGRYGELACGVLNAAEAPGISYAGIWLLLALHAPLAADNAALIEALGMPACAAYDHATQLLSEPHPTVAAAAASWLARGVTFDGTPPVPVEHLPGRDELDRWAADRTRGLIKEFPIEITPDTALVLASALVLTPGWSNPMRVTEDGKLLLRNGLQAVVDTRGAGMVAVAIPDTADDVDVISVIAAPDVPPDAVWRAAGEIVALWNSGDLAQHVLPAETCGHAWTVRREDRDVLAWKATPIDWTSTLPTWTTTGRYDVAAAPGVLPLAREVASRLDPSGEKYFAAQSATATYDHTGFSAAAVTAFGLYATGAPRFERRSVLVVEADFSRPHAVVAVARGGAWDGVPLFQSWVTPDMWTQRS